MLVPLVVLAAHLLTSHEYGLHRDELGLLDDARHLDWGYVSYPPVTPFLARVASDLFGPTLVGFRLLPALAMSTAVALAALMARDLGGGGRAQAMAAAATAIAPFSVLVGGLFMYVSFEYVLWVAVAFAVVRLLKSENPAWWVPIGALVGLGMMTKYSMAVCAHGLLVGLLLTPARRFLLSRWLLGSMLLALLIITPNLVWQAQHGFVSLEFLRTIHDRDVRIGRTQGYLPEQLFVGASPVTLPLWLGGLWHVLRSRSGARFRVLAWMYLVPFTLFLIAQGRSYYLAPAYPMLLAAGAVALDGALHRWPTRTQQIAQLVVGVALAVGAVISAGLMLPIAPIGSPLWEVTAKVHDNFSEQIGWPELVETTAGVYHDLSEETRFRTIILAGNYGEVGAINRYGPILGLPEALSGVNTSWYRGRNSPAPETAIVLGYRADAARAFFETCDVAARVTNRFGVANEESRDHPEIFVCRGLRQSWPETWSALRRFG